MNETDGKRTNSQHFDLLGLTRRKHMETIPWFMNEKKGTVLMSPDESLNPKLSLTLLQ